MQHINPLKADTPPFLLFGLGPCVRGQCQTVFSFLLSVVWASWLRDYYNTMSYYYT